MASSTRLRPAVPRGAGRPKVVLVDDNPMTVKLAEYMFREDGWEFRGFTSAKKALEALETFEPDLIISDFRMPEMNGPEFVLAASQMHDLTPTLIVTAFDDDEAVIAELRKASVPCLRKTEGLTELVLQARNLVSVRQSLKCKTFSVGISA
ncbi:MAG: response regulator [Planctomycetes bacterium]|nr:response regulator [Planctomycetota bacterium]